MVDDHLRRAAHVAPAVVERELRPERLDLGDVVDDPLDLLGRDRRHRADRLAGGGLNDSSSWPFVCAVACFRWRLPCRALCALVGPRRRQRPGGQLRVGDRAAVLERAAPCGRSQPSSFSIAGLASSISALRCVAPRWSASDAIASASSLPMPRLWCSSSTTSPISASPVSSSDDVAQADDLLAAVARRRSPRSRAARAGRRR